MPGAVGEGLRAQGNDSLLTNMEIVQNFSHWNRQTDIYQLNNSIACNQRRQHYLLFPERVGGGVGLAME